ncbi:cytochrome P450 4V2-like [Lycorma delicatula]|uniref:cytochrome P450 4V2-like n=1 Tax=Lycorma delicatula TaxID=130591 RepID=UPI003F51464F
MLAMHEEWQEKVHRELDEYFGDSDCNVTINDITKLQTLDIVFKESLRLSATPHTLRQLDEDTKVDKYTVPTGTLVYIPVYILHRDSRYWSHPDEFYPEHFLPKNEDKRPRCSYIPFTFGPRNCIGGKYGTTFTKIMLIHILRKFKLSTELKYHELKYKPKVMLEVANGYYIKLHRRK